MSAISAISSATSQPTMALLQLQMLQYYYIANGPNWQGKADYEALQNAIDAGNVSSALVALGRLQREGKIPSPQDASATSQAAVTPSPQTISDTPASPAISVGNPASGSSLNATA